MHSRIAPSSAGRWVNCSGSVVLEGMFADQKTEAAIEGDAAHWVAASFVDGRDVPVGTVTPVGPVVTGEMREAAQLYASSISESTTSHVAVETRVEAPNVHPSSFGTVDAFSFDGTVLHIFDFKYGHGLVEVFENWQLINYAAGLLHGVARTAVEVRMTIIQPRCYQAEPVRTWTISVANLEPYILRLRQAAARALGLNPPTLAGGWCRYCQGRSVCETLQAACGYVMDFAGHATPRNLDDKSLTAELAMMQDAATLLKSRIEALEEIITVRLKAGELLPRFSLKPGGGREKWDRPVGEILALGKLLNADLTAPVKPITPAQARKAGIPADVVAHFVAARTGVKLTRDDGTKAREVFGG